ncbi:MAG: BTAD domain-containing putative transcriptional regulator [Deltaproteobacteria bacterium]|jgi:predicted Zn-dependent protease
MADKPGDLTETLIAVAKGDLPLSMVAGLSAKELAQVLSQALAQMQIGRDDKALPILKVLVALDEKNPIFHEYLGLAYERLGRHDEALEAYSRNIEALGSLTSAEDRLCEGYLLRARLNAQRGELSDAKHDVEAAKRHSKGVDAEMAQEIAVLEQVLGEARP